jgi:hypothetical protein
MFQAISCLVKVRSTRRFALRLHTLVTSRRLLVRYKQCGRAREAKETINDLNNMMFRPVLGFTQPFLESEVGVMLLGRQTDHSPLSMSFFEWIYTSTPPYPCMTFTGTALLNVR